MIDEASQEILAFQLSTSPNKELIMRTLEELIDNLPDGAQPIIHSVSVSLLCLKASELSLCQNMSCKDCLDNAPVEIFFHLYKTELPVGFPLCKNVTELGKLFQNYVQYFNDVRTTKKTKGMVSVEYRNHVLVA